MIAKVASYTLVAAAVLVGLPGDVAPVGSVAAQCYQIEDVDPCFNPCNEIGGAYQRVRDATGKDLGDLHCTE